MKNRFTKIRPQKQNQQSMERRQELLNEFKPKVAEEESSSSDFQMPEELNKKSNVFKPPEEETTQRSRRMVIRDLDWQIINAKDIFVLANSFLPVGGILESV